VNLRELLTSDPQAPLESIMVRRVVTAALDDKKSDIAELFCQVWIESLAVVDKEAGFMGSSVSRACLTPWPRISAERFVKPVLRQIHRLSGESLY